MRVSIITIGTRGDVDPFIALALGLAEHGYDVKIATLAEFGASITAHGIGHVPLRGDYLALAQPSSDERTTRSLAASFRTVREYVRMATNTLEDEWEAAKDAELLIYSPAAFGGFHIAEKLGVPSFAAFPSPLYSPTSDFPSPFFPFANLGPLNKPSHRAFAVLAPILFRKPIAEWRKHVLGLPTRNREDIPNERRVPLLYAFSPHVVPPPPDWDESVRVTGYWFLKHNPEWTPPPDLSQFLEQGPPPIYVGFGSMAAFDHPSRNQLVLDAIRMTEQRAIIASPSGHASEQPSSPAIHLIHEAPHDWLLPRVALVVHHGGAGTTGAALRAGKPSVVVPFVGDQRFWAQRIFALGAGPRPIPRRRLTARRLAAAISAAMDAQYSENALSTARRIGAEDGVLEAVKYILSHLTSS